ncbi:MAG: elongation factor P [Bacillales bacterium]|nr:elongation factor P [Bacillales bacterium]MDY6003409.1 elongation factor P [Bacilli bacterium]
MNVTEIRPGNYFIDEDNLYLCLDILLNKTAMRKMVAAIKAKNMRTGSIVQISRNSGYDVEPVRLDKKKMSYLYDSGDSLVFMDQVTYDQVEIAKSKLEWEMNFLVADAEIEILAYEDEILGISLPSSVALTIVDCEPAVRGDTVNKAMKFATLETGYRVKVPLFINNGEKILVRTDTGLYDGRA